MAAKLNLSNMKEAIAHLQKEFGGDELEGLRDKSHKEWLKQLGHADLFTTPTDPTEWLKGMLSGVPKDLKAPVQIMIFGYANFLINHCASLLAEKDVEITFRNDYIFRHCKFDDFIKVHDAALQVERDEPTES